METIIGRLPYSEAELIRQLLEVRLYGASLSELKELADMSADDELVEELKKRFLRGTRCPRSSSAH
jgi:hypothetical protein